MANRADESVVQEALVGPVGSLTDVLEVRVVSTQASVEHCHLDTSAWEVQRGRGERLVGASAGAHTHTQCCAPTSVPLVPQHRRLKTVSH